MTYSCPEGCLVLLLVTEIGKTIYLSPRAFYPCRVTPCFCFSSLPRNGGFSPAFNQGGVLNMRKLIMFALKIFHIQVTHEILFYVSYLWVYRTFLKHHTFAFFIYFINIYLFGCVGFQLWHVEIFWNCGMQDLFKVVAYNVVVVARGIYSLARDLT